MTSVFFLDISPGSYRDIGRSYMGNASPAWPPIIRKLSQQKLQKTQKTALRAATGALCFSSDDHLHNKTKMLKIASRHHLLKNQFLAQATQENHPCNQLWTFEP